MAQNGKFKNGFDIYMNGDVKTKAGNESSAKLAREFAAAYLPALAYL